MKRSELEILKENLMKILEDMIDGYLESDDADVTEVLLLLENANNETFSISVFPGPPTEDTVMLLKTATESVKREIAEAKDDGDEEIPTMPMEYLH